LHRFFYTKTSLFSTQSLQNILLKNSTLLLSQVAFSTLSDNFTQDIQVQSGLFTSDGFTTTENDQKLHNFSFLGNVFFVLFVK
jgi:hypothetical protein